MGSIKIKNNLPSTLEVENIEGTTMFIPHSEEMEVVISTNEDGQLPKVKVSLFDIDELDAE